MSRIRVQLTGDKAMQKKLKAVASDSGLRKEARGALLEVGGVLLETMRSRTPRKSGKLQDSEKLRALVSAKKGNLRVTLVAGGPDVLYAKRVHETHKTQSKFMESTLNEAVPTAGKDIAEKIDLARAAKEGA